MAFGFPAYHEETIDLEIPRNEIISFLEPIVVISFFKRGYQLNWEF